MRSRRMEPLERNMEINAQDLLVAVEGQRNALANENAQLKAYIAKLERKIGEAKDETERLMPGFGPVDAARPIVQPPARLHHGEHPVS